MPDVANPIGSVLNSLPMEMMFAKPLMAALDAHTAMCIQLGEFIDRIGFVTPVAPATGPKSVRMVDWAWTAPQYNDAGDATGKTLDLKASIPFLSMVPIPALAVDEVTVDFELEVNTSESSSSSTEAEASLSGTVGFAWWKASFSAKVSHKSEQTRKTDTRAKYSVHIKATRQNPPEALMRMIDMVVDTVTRPQQKKPA
jgi:hypothetical protein